MYRPLFVIIVSAGISWVCAEEAATMSDALTQGQFGAFARYRLDSVDDDTKPEAALASTLRTALSYASKPFHGLSGVVELYSVNSLGPIAYNWLGNPHATAPEYARYPNINDPENAGFSQCYGQWASPSSDYRVRVGRQLIALNDEQWLTASRYRQNQSVVDTAWFTASPGAGFTFDGGYLWANRDVVARHFRLDGYIGNLAYRVGDTARLTAYGIWTDYQDSAAAGNDLQTMGLRVENQEHKQDPWQVLYIVDVAAQSPAFDNPSSAEQHSWYGLLDLGVRVGEWSLRASLTHRDGTNDHHDVIKAPLGYPYPYRGETEQFVATPTDGVRIVALRGGGPLPAIAGLRLTGFVWDFSAVESSDHYGTETCLQADYVTPWLKNWTWSLRAAHFWDADTDTEANPTYGREQTRLIAMTSVWF
jgi:hypothetical protein